MEILFVKIKHHHHLVNLYSYVIMVNYTHIPLLKFFEKNSSKDICQWSERMYLCGFVALCFRMCVAGTNKVEDTIS